MIYQMQYDFDGLLFEVELGLKIDTEAHPANPKVQTHRVSANVSEMRLQGSEMDISEAYTVLHPTIVDYFYAFHEDDAINQFLNER